MATYFVPGRGKVWKTIVGKDGKQRKVQGGYRYDFVLFGHRYVAPRGFTRKSDSEDAEDELRRRIKLQARRHRRPRESDVTAVRKLGRRL